MEVTDLHRAFVDAFTPQPGMPAYSPSKLADLAIEVIKRWTAKEPE